ncbi:Deoxyribodipyrimidine photo-lyase [Aquicella siphonis]|uniref:Deoxyribodipyrimidine photo-lyase n=1 Tax=Aquicella siphonis TaxID=254247 RepID=A0A5E4PJL6_9COXI|nr:deoxyribodipyrimidine photo-lyase [Aquicella siphonis]VVC76541.1 Deoxyribodipyrimidine photo-lyase [Aquicella siphonis]
MAKPYRLALHIFRRDLRLDDNTSLAHALDLSDQVIPCFIFDKRQIELNDYKSDNSIQFMAQSLKELDARLRDKHTRLFCFYGIAEQVIQQLIASEDIQAVFINRDYTPFSKARDHQIEKTCAAHGVAYHCFADVLLHEPEEIQKPDGGAYTVFTHFLNKAAPMSVQPPRKNKRDNYYQGKLTAEDKSTLEKLSRKQNPVLAVKGGRKEALTLLQKACALTDYTLTRDIPSLNGTSRLSAHNKFGTLSIREFYFALANQSDKDHALIRELFWRDFFTYIAFHFPRVFGHAFQEKFAHIEWSRNEKHFRAWCEGRTGFPIVDAGMRELNATGYMHNRARMITASFLVKDLHIDWRWGEKYFAQKLVDYDPAVNNGNWQWAASTGCDAQPYFRIFNPWLQQKKFDPDCLYIKRWIPELAAQPPDVIHTLYRQSGALMTNYPHPLVDHAIESGKAKAVYQLSRSR